MHAMSSGFCGWDHVLIIQNMGLELTEFSLCFWRKGALVATCGLTSYDLLYSQSITLQYDIAHELNHLRRESSQDYGQMGLRYGSKNLSCGVSVTPFAGMLPDFHVNEAFRCEIKVLRILYALIFFSYPLYYRLGIYENKRISPWDLRFCHFSSYTTIFLWFWFTLLLPNFC